MIVYFFVWLATLLTLIVNGSGYAISFGDTQNNHTSDNTSPSLRRRAADPADFSWIKRWACVGDSFSAGIGSGDVYSNRRADVACSRYDYSYPAIMNRKFGPSVQTFEYWVGVLRDNFPLWIVCLLLILFRHTSRNGSTDFENFYRLVAETSPWTSIIKSSV